LDCAGKNSFAETLIKESRATKRICWTVQVRIRSLKPILSNLSTNSFGLDCAGKNSFAETFEPQRLADKSKVGLCR